MLVAAEITEWVLQEEYPEVFVPISASQILGVDGYVVAMLASVAEISNFRWDEQFSCQVKQHMKLTMTDDGQKHKGNSGEYFWFGYIKKYTPKIHDGASYGRVSMKPNPNVRAVTKIEEKCTRMSRDLCVTIEKGFLILFPKNST